MDDPGGNFQQLDAMILSKSFILKINATQLSQVMEDRSLQNEKIFVISSGYP